MPFKAWEDVDPNHLELPIRGKVYRIPPIGYLDEIRIRAAQNAYREAQRSPDDEPAADPVPESATPMSDQEFLEAVLSAGVLAAMREDNVPGIAITHAAAVAHTAHTQGRAVAEELWNAGFDPEAVAAEMAALRDRIDQATAPAEPGPTATDTPPSPSTASASPTPSPASTTRTTSRKRSPRKQAAKKSTSTRSSSRRT